MERVERLVVSVREAAFALNGKTWEPILGPVDEDYWPDWPEVGE